MDELDSFGGRTLSAYGVSDILRSQCSMRGTLAVCITQQFQP
jgi:hypothetical protein